MFRKKRTPQQEVDEWVSLWEQIHSRLALLASQNGDVRFKAELVQFAVDLERIAGIARTGRLPIVESTAQVPADAPSPPPASPPGDDFVQPSSFFLHPPSPRAVPDKRKPAIIIVEDEPDILIIFHRLLRDMLNPETCDIIPKVSGAEALAEVTLRRVPLVITDYKMPGMDGLQLNKAIKESSPDTKVLMITAYATPELEQKARKQGVDYYLPKPHPLDRLEDILREVLG